jgi:hypothetical protein
MLGAGQLRFQSNYSQNQIAIISVLDTYPADCRLPGQYVFGLRCSVNVPGYCYFHIAGHLLVIDLLAIDAGELW